MKLRKWMLRGAKWGAVSLVGLVVLLAALVQGQQWLLRWRAERLMADMHRIRLYQSTWADAQRLMRKWGRWGHYDGTCTAESCRYRITLSDWAWGDPSAQRPRWLGWLIEHRGLDVYTLLGGRPARISAGVVVQDGAILREFAGIAIDVPRWQDPKRPEYELTLAVSTRSRPSLRGSKRNPWVLGTDSQLAEHPYYKAGRPDGCEINCEEAVVTYSTRTPPPEIERLSSFNFSCLTRYFACQTLEEILPAAKRWHLYNEGDLLPAPGVGEIGERSCGIPLWAMARDQQNILLGEFDGEVTPRGEGQLLATVQFLDALKGQIPFSKDARPAAIIPLVVSGASAPPVSGKRYILFPQEDFRGETESVGKDVPAVEIPACGMWEDTPANRLEIAKGIAMNDDLRGPEQW